MDKYRVKLCYGERCTKKTVKIVDHKTASIAIYVVIAVEADEKMVVGIPVGKLEGKLEDEVINFLNINMDSISATLTKIEEVEKATYNIKPRKTS